MARCCHVRPANGVYLPPTVLRLDGKSTVVNVGVVKKDMPNFFVEADTIADGQLHTEVKEIVVPSEKRILNVEVRPDHEAYKPGEKARVKVKLTDLEGHAFVGSTVVAIYDKSVEYISGGSNVPDIKEFFWKWRRYHYFQGETSLGRSFQNLVLPNTIGMSDLGFPEARWPRTWVQCRAETRNGHVKRCGRGNDVWRPGGGVGKRVGRGERESRWPPMAAPPMAARAASHEARRVGRQATIRRGDGQQMVQPTVRTKFADTALGVGNLTTNNDGMAEVSLDMPENLTTWRIKVWGMGQGTRVGQGQTDVVTRKDLIIRMEAPRFFVQTDEVVLSAVVHNYLKTKKSVKVALELGP